MNQMKKGLNKICRRLRSKRGESLVEILVAMTVCLFAILALMTSIVSTSHITSDAREVMDGYYEANNLIEKMMSGETVTEENPNITVTTGTITIAGKSGSDASAFFGDSVSYKTDVYINSSVAAGSDPVLIYKIHTDTPVHQNDGGSDE